MFRSNRNQRVAALAAFFVTMLSACSAEKYDDSTLRKENEPKMVAPVLAGKDAVDIHSYARPEEARVTHIALDLTADFKAKRLSGTATLDIAAQDDAKAIILDSKGLEIHAITDDKGAALPWTLGSADPIRGQPLKILLNGARQIRIDYRSAPDAGALQWLDPQQTAGKKYPFLFSQGQSILNRSWIPTQDSPGIRQTWEARIVAPEPLKVVMSADALTPDGEVARGGRAYRFRMDKPVAPYLIALAIGDIAFQSLGPRTGVYAEPSQLKAAAWEFADVGKMVDTAEKLYGPYRWGRYDLLVLPPSFPFGGMENPRLTFATPTVIAGDRSLVSLVAHELAHSWSGNLVTNATWSDFWLNEGFTTYFESRIMESLYGPDQAAMLIRLEWDELQAAIAKDGGMASPSTMLHLNLAGKDPDEGMADVAYQKGAAFLRTIEAGVGRPRWDEYLRGYFDRYAFQPATTALFLADLRKHLIKGDQGLEARLKLDEWAYGTGIPDNVMVPTSAALDRVDTAVRAFAATGDVAAVPFATWNSQEKVHFLVALPRSLQAPLLASLDQSFGLGKSGNSEVTFAWLQVALANRYDPAIPVAERFLTTMGRRKFVVPLFETLFAQGDWGRPIAERIYARARPGYHPVTSGSVDKVLASKR